MLPSRLLAADAAAGHSMGWFDGLLVATAVLLGMALWEAGRRKQRRLAVQADNRVREMTALIEHADCLLWEAEVHLRPGDWLWRMTLHQSAFSRKLFAGAIPTPGVDLWQHYRIDRREEMDRRARDAMEQGLSGYRQDFHAVKADQELWLHENVSITPMGKNRFWLVGLVTDITAQRAAEEARRKSELHLSHLLERADTMIWQSQVRRLEDGTLFWEMFVPKSQLYRRIFAADPENPVGFAWKEKGVPEHAEIERRAVAAILSGAPGYDQVFHVPRPGGDIWLNEAVTVVPTGPDTWDLVGIITDITARRAAEEAWRTSQARLGQLLEMADCLVWDATVTLLPGDVPKWDLYTQRSVLYRRIFGDGEPQGLPWHTLVVPELPEMIDRTRDAIKSRAPGYTQEFHIEHPDGVIWLRETVTMVQLKENVSRMVGVITDITAQHLANTARQTSEQRLQKILTRAECLLWEATVTLSPGGWAWQFNVQPSLLCQKLYGAPLPPAEGGLWDRFAIPERGEMDQRCRRALEQGRSGYEQIFRILRPDGSVIWISESITIRVLGDRQYSLVGVALDITAQRGAELALAAEKERLSVTLRAMKECVITTDVAGVVQFINHAAATLTGWGAAEAVGQPVAGICRLQNTRNNLAVEVPIGRVAQGDIIVDLPAHTRLVTRAEGRRQIEGCCAPIHAADSKVIGTVFVFRDVTEQEQLEQELVRATRLESVGVLAGGIAHDFNNILTAVMGNLALAQLDVPPDTPAGSSLRSAEKAALRARDLTQQLLTFARGGEPVRAAVQLDAIVREMTAFALHGSQVKAHYDIAPDLWPADADKGQIGRVVQNLVINAVQAMPQGGTLTVSVRNDPHDGMSQPGLGPGDYIRIGITDTGEGIKPEHVARIFDPYFTTKQTGTGLGLAAVYSIVKKHRGHIDVDSQIGQGTTFRIWLPALRNHAAHPDTRSPWAAGVPETMSGRVLFMDDEEIIRNMATGLLRRFGLTVDCAADGAEAVQKYQAAFGTGAKYDLVIMDLTVPGGMGGLAALAKLRETDPAVRAVVSSGYSSDPVLANFRAHGFAAVVAKPYETREIARVLREVLAGR